MIGRVTQGFMVNDFNNNLRDRQSEIQKVQDQLASGYRIQLPSDDPVGTINYMDYDSRLKEIHTYSRIAEDQGSKLNLIDAKLDSVTQLTQRMRELAVQGANGIYSKDERRNMAVEVDQLLREMIAVSNSQYKGESLFGGTRNSQPPFVSKIAVDPKTGTDFVESVRYLGNNQSQIAEIDAGQRVITNRPGNQIFWADNMEMHATLPSTGYVAPRDSKIFVDGIKIDIRRGDNLDVISDKINRSGAAVRASVVTKSGTSFFNIETTSPHQLSLMDAEGGEVLSDIGLIESGVTPPDNYAPTAKVYTGSIFDVMIKFRKSLLEGNVFKIGGTSLNGIDMTLGNINKIRTRLGAVSERLDSLRERFSNEEIYVTDARDKTIGTDVPKAIMQMKMLEFSHNVALSVGGRLMPKTLLDFLR